MSSTGFPCHPYLPFWHLGEKWELSSRQESNKRKEAQMKWQAQRIRRSVFRHAERGLDFCSSQSSAWARRTENFILKPQGRIFHRKLQISVPKKFFEAWLCILNRYCSAALEQSEHLHTCSKQLAAHRTTTTTQRGWCWDHKTLTFNVLRQSLAQSQIAKTRTEADQYLSSVAQIKNRDPTDHIWWPLCIWWRRGGGLRPSHQEVPAEGVLAEAG